MRILIADDIVLARQLLVQALKSYGDIEVAANGQQAIECFHKAWKEEKPFDIIFLDIMMPEMDGHEALRIIRHFEKVNSVSHPVKVVISTALGDSENVLSSFKEGAEFYLVKPIELKRLYGIMSDMGFHKASV